MEVSDRETTDSERLTRARSRLLLAIASKDSKQIVSAAYEVIYSWAWRPGSEIASADGRFTVRPSPGSGFWWGFTFDLGIALDSIVCRVQAEAPVEDLAEGLERALGTLERSWVADREERAAEVDGLLERLVLPREVGGALRRALVLGQAPNLDSQAATRIGDRLREHGVWYRVLEGEHAALADVRWPTPPRYTKREWLADPEGVWAAVEAYGSVVLTNDDGSACGGISKPKGPLRDE